MVLMSHMQVSGYTELVRLLLKSSSSSQFAVGPTILDLVLTVNEMLFSDGGFKPWRDRSKIIPHTVSVHYA